MNITVLINVHLFGFFFTEFHEKVNKLKEYLPTYEDLNGAVAALLRLQDTYKLETEKIAAGDIAGIKTSELSGEFCSIHVSVCVDRKKKQQNISTKLNLQTVDRKKKKEKTIYKHQPSKLSVQYIIYTIYMSFIKKRKNI